VRDATCHLSHRPQPLLLKHLPLRVLELRDRLFELAMAALQRRRRSMALGDVVEADDETGQARALDHGRGHVVDGEIAAVAPREDLVGGTASAAVTERREDRPLLDGNGRAVGFELA
jgi:hypothetical protein